jgi:hypothetical protein
LTIRSASWNNGKRFVGSLDRDVCRYPDCADVHKIKPENLVKYQAAPDGKRLHTGCQK